MGSVPLVLRNFQGSGVLYADGLGHQDVVPLESLIASQNDLVAGPGLNVAATSSAIRFTPSASYTGSPITAGQWAFLGNATQSTETCYSIRQYQVALRATQTIFLVWPGTYNASNAGLEAANPNVTEVKAAIELAGVTIPVFFKGNRLTLRRPGVCLVSDPISIVLAAGTVFYTRFFENILADSTYTSATGEVGLLTSNQTSTVGYSYTRGGANASTDSYVASTSTGVNPFTTADVVDSTGAMSTTGILTFSGPTVVADVQDTVSTVTIMGTSIEAGLYDSWVGVPCSGYANRGTYAAGLPAINCGIGTFQYQLGEIPGTSRLARGIVENSGNIVVVGGPTNDLVTGNLTGAQMIANTQTVIGRLKALGKKVVLTTMTPRTTSTDYWATVANQSLRTQEPNRLIYNAWVRTGPAAIGVDAIADLNSVMDNGAGYWIGSTVVATGTTTSGSSVQCNDTTQAWTTNQWAGYVAHDLTNLNTIGTILYSTATSLVTYNSGSWGSGDTYNILQQYTVDGTHPSGLGHALMSNVLAAALNGIKN